MLQGRLQDLDRHLEISLPLSLDSFQVDLSQKKTGTDPYYGVVKAGIQTILDFLATHLVVDLQLIIETETGRVVIIDPATIYLTTNAENMEEHGSSYNLTLGVLNAAKEQLEAIISPSVAAAGLRKTKEGLEALYESLEMDDTAFKERIKAMLEKAHMDASDTAVEKYVELSGCT